MVLIVSQSWYPASQAEKSGKNYLDVLKKYPEDRTLGKPLVRAAVKMTENGIHTIAISSVKEGKVKEVMDQAVNVALMSSKAIEGLKTSIDIYYDLAEAMPFVGLKAPEQ
jgi:hypothetical protein